MSSAKRYGHFVAVFEHGSLLKASEAINLSQPALSKSIRALEDEYGVTLFDRQPRGVTPTAFGRALERHARRILLDIEQSRQDLSAIASGAAGRLRIGVGQALVEVVEQALSELENDYPQIETLLMTDYAEGLTAALLENRIDLMFGMTNRLETDDNFQTVVLATDRIVGLCNADHEFAGRKVTLPELVGTAWVVPERGEIVRSALEAFLLVNRQALPRYRMITNIPSVVGRYVRDYGVLSLLPERSLSSYRHYDLATFDIKGFEYIRKIGTVQRAGVYHSEALRAFAAALTRVLDGLETNP
ncbi:LysR family transcriptional regulator [Roseobacter cerasinus]|uniref:LysR family transcriptional regulator n=1 Tax=Roseobacter cerasinus TaxID=2602289 RepID=A0A640VUS0_9RHOB|nr:LysR family transcriptional regulator [Roseobacter cerasinus]GFE51903.1 LysR family transcriptional regulator [Roseobacter cerasinus]